MQNARPSRSKSERSIGVHASDNKNSDSGKEDNPLTASEIKDLRQPVTTLFRNEPNQDQTITINENYQKEDYQSLTSL